MKKMLIVFLAVCIAHVAEHVVQAVQIYILNVPTHKAGGILGSFWPWLMHSETLHYGYAAVMLGGLWLFRDQFTGNARWWWMAAFGLQFWHHIEHFLLLCQAATGQNFFGAPQPISIIQLTGFLHGTAESGFDGLLTMSHFGACDCEGAAPGTFHEWTWKLLTVRRVEVHLIYNVLVAAPMTVAMLRDQKV